MKVLAIAAAVDAQRFVRGHPYKGAWLFLRPDLEICRLWATAPADEFVYVDERVAVVETGDDFDLVLVRMDFNQDNSARLITEVFERLKKPVVIFGPLATFWQNQAPDWIKHRVVGDITLVWEQIRADFANGRLRSVYFAPNRPNYVVPRMPVEGQTVLNTRYQPIYFVRGCSCPRDYKGLCREFLYYQENLFFRSRDEIIGEIVSLPFKHIHLLDEDVARFPDYYRGMFRLVWWYRKHWTVNASDRIFNYPDLIRLLAKSGTKVIFLNETFINSRLNLALRDERVVKWLYRRVKFLHSRRILVGAKLTLPASDADYAGVANLLCRIDLDFIEVRFLKVGFDGRQELVPITYHPMLQPDEPAWIKSRFYALDVLLNRFVRRPRRVGFYSTGYYLIPYSLAYRQNFLEGLPYP